MSSRGVDRKDELRVDDLASNGAIQLRLTYRRDACRSVKCAPSPNRRLGEAYEDGLRGIAPQAVHLRQPRGA